MDNQQKTFNVGFAGMRAGALVATLWLSACGFEGSGAEEAGALQDQRTLIAGPAAPSLRAADIPSTAGSDSSASRSDRITVKIPDSSAGWIEMQHPGQESKHQLCLGLPSARGAKRGVRGLDGTVMFRDVLPATDVAVQAQHRGLRVQMVLQDQTAPSEFAFTIDISGAARFLPSVDGSLLVVDGQGAPRAGLAAPAALDQQARRVPARYEVRGGTLVLRVDHSGASLAYPIVVNTWLGFDLIDSAWWGMRDGGWTLFVKPTAWARANGGGYLVGAAGWDELYSKYKDHGLTKNLNGMRDQFICHQQIAFWKSTYNLDEWRPDVGYLATLADLCNPGGPGD